MTNAAVFIDGSNFYNGLKDLAFAIPPNSITEDSPTG
jgi:hypothetical protein